MNYKTKLNIKNYIGQSRVGGRGVFAGKNYKYGEIIEIAYCIKDDPNNYSKAILRDYLFRIDNNNSLICLGYGSFYSHNDNPNCRYIVNNDTIVFVCKQSIKKDDEIFISYGNNWWKSRKDRLIKKD